MFMVFYDMFMRLYGLFDKSMIVHDNCMTHPSLNTLSKLTQNCLQSRPHTFCHRMTYTNMSLESVLQLCTTCLHFT